MYLTDPKTERRVRELSSRLADVLRTVKGPKGDAGAPVLKANRRILAYVRRKKLRIQCHCRPEGPTLTVRKLDPLRYVPVNLPNTPVPHAEDCVFGRVYPGDANQPKPPAPTHHADVCNPFPKHERRPAAEPRINRKSSGLSRDEPPKTMMQILWKMMKKARLNRLSEADGFSAPEAWLAEIRRAANELYLPPKIRVSEFLFTDPQSWSGGEVRDRLDAAWADWPDDEQPIAFLCWPADHVGDNEINKAGRSQGHVRVTLPVVSPSIHGNRVAGPYLFLGAVARFGNAQRWKCVKACAQPIVDPECPIPVESGYERSALKTLRHMVRTLQDNRELRHALGGDVRVDLRKPLTRIEVKGGPCLPDFLVTVKRPGADTQLPDGPGHPQNFHGFNPRDSADYIIEVMGFDDQEYEQNKEKTHRRMKQLGRLFRMEGQEFDSRDNSLKHQGEKITLEIAKDLLKRWTAGRKSRLWPIPSSEAGPSQNAPSKP